MLLTQLTAALPDPFYERMKSLAFFGWYSVVVVVVESEGRRRKEGGEREKSESLTYEDVLKYHAVFLYTRCVCIIIVVNNNGSCSS